MNPDQWPFVQNLQSAGRLMAAFLDKETAIMLDSFYHLIGEDIDLVTWWQMGIRATIIFFWAILLYRLFPRRAFSSSSTTDIVLVVIVGSALSRAMTGTAPLIPTIFATALLGVLYLLVMQIAARHRWVGPIVKGRSIPLVHDGKIDRDAIRRAQMDEGDLREILRIHGVSDVNTISTARLERNGQVSIFRRG